mgnify:FL=1
MERSVQKVNELVENSVRDLSKLVNVDTVIGTPILTASGVQIIPVTKVTMGFLSGGSDIGETKVIKEKESVPFAGGSGAVVSLKPAGFLLDDGKNCRYIHAGDDPLDNLIDKASDLLKGFADAGE